MPGRERRRGSRAARWMFAAMIGAMAAALGGCGQSGPLYLPQEGSAFAAEPRAAAGHLLRV